MVAGTATTVHCGGPARVWLQRSCHRLPDCGPGVPVLPRIAFLSLRMAPSERVDKLPSAARTRSLLQLDRQAIAATVHTDSEVRPPAALNRRKGLPTPLSPCFRPETTVAETAQEAPRPCVLAACGAHPSNPPLVSVLRMTSSFINVPRRAKSLRVPVVVDTKARLDGDG
jgi:hypothetical protein